MSHTSPSYPSKAQVIQVSPDFPNPDLPNANWADVFEIGVTQNGGTRRTRGEQTIGGMPLWAQALLKVRRILVAPLGLNFDGLKNGKGDEDSIDFFPIFEELKNRIVPDIDDRNPDFRGFTDHFETRQGFRAFVSPLVYRRIALGWGYVAIVSMLPQLIVNPVLEHAV